MFAQLVKKFTALFETQRFIPVFRIAIYLSLCISHPSYSFKKHNSIILFICLGSQNCLLPSSSLTRNLYAFLFFPIYTAYTFHLIQISDYPNNSWYWVQIMLFYPFFSNCLHLRFKYSSQLSVLGCLHSILSPLC